MVCSNCGTENQPGRKFCSACGTRLAVACPSCGATNASTDQFCGECGTGLGTRAPSGTAVPPPGPAIGSSATTALAVAPAAERRVVSVLFADLVGFTALSESRDPEAVRELLTRYFELASETVTRYGGVVEKFIGDAVMAVWGTPTAHEDDVERAVRTALELVDAVQLLGKRADGASLQLRAGVLTGEAAVTIGATNQGMVAGDLVNTASRLQSLAAPGTVLVGEGTFRAASGAIVFEPIGDQALKGKSLPVPAWRALRVVAKRGGAGRSEGLEPPFVGRDAELRLLKELFHATARERRTRLVSVTGVAGIGKSRLAWEFSKYTDGVAETVYWHQGRSPAYGEGITYWALGEMIRQRAGLAESDDQATSRARIAASVAEYVADEGERRWIEPRLLALLGLEEGRPGEREELFAAWRTFFERIAERGPTVLVFDDLQWADPGLLDFIDHLLEWSRAQPIYLVALARPELLERRSDWGAGRRNFVALSLEPLSDGDMRGLLAGLVPGLPEPVVGAILARAEGVPLYAVETVRMLLHEGRLTTRDGAYRPVGDLTRLDVPETLQALIAARLDALEPADRTLLQDASVLGQTFTLASLAAISGQEPEALEARLRLLARRDLLEQDVDPRSPERGQYGFVQGLIREVAYGTLARRDRRSRHLAAARHFEGLGDDELAGILATHYRDAYLASPEGPDGEAVAVQARLALRGAAERAAALYSHEQALAYLEQALATSPDRAEEADLLERAGASATLVGHHDDAERSFSGAVARYRELGDTAGAARAAARLGGALVAAGRIEDAITTLEGALSEFPNPETEPAVAGMMAQLARAYMIHEEPQAALDWAERTLVAAERLDLVAEIAEAMITRALVLQILGRFREATTSLRGVLWLAEDHGLAMAELRAYTNLSFLLASDDPRAGLAVATEGIERARRFGSRQWSALLASNAAASAFRAGEFSAAESTIAEWTEAATDAIAGVELHCVAAAIAGARGEPAEARIDALRPFIATATDPQLTAVIQMARAWVALAEGRLADAFEQAMDGARHATGYAVTGYHLAVRAAAWAGDRGRAQAAADAFAAIGVHGRGIEAARRTIEGTAAALDGRVHEAATAFGDAARRWRDLRVDFELAMCDLDIVTLIGPDDPDGRAAAAEARAILQRLDARAFLARLDAVPARSRPPREARSGSGVPAG